MTHSRLAPRFLQDDQDSPFVEALARGRDGRLPSPLTGRQTEVMSLVAYGHSNKEIATSLGISEQTVKNHVNGVLCRLAVPNRTMAAIVALLSGWLAPVWDPPRHQAGRG